MNDLDREQLDIFQTIGHLHAQITSILTMASALTCYEVYGAGERRALANLAELTNEFSAMWAKYLKQIQAYAARTSSSSENETIH